MVLRERKVKSLAGLNGFYCHKNDHLLLFCAIKT